MSYWNTPWGSDPDRITPWKETLYALHVRLDGPKASVDWCRKSNAHTGIQSPD